MIVGAEHVSFSAVATLAHAGASVAGLVTELPRHQSLAAFRAGAAVRYRAPVWSRTAVSAIHGNERVESVELTELDSGSTRSVDCDLVIFTADWIPDHELAVMAGCELDPGSLGPLVDPALRTTRRGVFAAGNLLHPAETADVCALDGRHVAPSVAAYLHGPGEWPSHVRLVARDAARLDRPQPDARHRRTTRRATASCCARASSPAARASRSARTGGSSGAGASAASSRGGRRTSRPGGPPASTRAEAQ